MVSNSATRLACEFQRTEWCRHDEHETQGWSQHRSRVAPRLTGPLRETNGQAPKEEVPAL
jgi:hypothetical protein